MENVQTEQQEQAQQPIGLTLQDMKILAGAVELACNISFWYFL